MNKVILLGPRVKPGDDGGWGCGQFHFSDALARLGLIDDCVFVVLPRLAGHGPRLLDGLTRVSELTLAERLEFASETVVVRV